MIIIIMFWILLLLVTLLVCLHFRPTGPALGPDPQKKPSQTLASLVRRGGFVYGSLLIRVLTRDKSRESEGPIEIRGKFNGDPGSLTTRKVTC